MDRSEYLIPLISIVSRVWLDMLCLSTCFYFHSFLVPLGIAGCSYHFPINLLRHCYQSPPIVYLKPVLVPKIHNLICPHLPSPLSTLPLKSNHKPNHSILTLLLSVLLPWVVKESSQLFIRDFSSSFEILLPVESHVARESLM